jgi:hypothetical protein
MAYREKLPNRIISGGIPDTHAFHIESGAYVSSCSKCCEMTEESSWILIRNHEFLSDKSGP